MSSPGSGHWWWSGGQRRQGRRKELGSMMAEIGWRRVGAQLKSKRVRQVFFISINLEEYKKVELSALQCLGNLKSWCHVLVTFSSGSKSSVLDPASASVLKPQKKPSLVQSPADSSIPTSPGKRTLLTLHQLFTKDSPAASVQYSQAPHHSSTPTSVHQTCCASSPCSSSTSITCQNKLVKLFSCLLSVILDLGQICKENYDSMEVFKSKALHTPWLKRDEDLTLIGWGRGT
ncbi:hypothetical protein CRENBAI_020033 [Crenichthys baileyi]|uniref:Uncharacterized protein n=1 Tax=Crenichthys baileyi TaxID=28760 RepID=A0AAV9S3I3_9TELE